MTKQELEQQINASIILTIVDFYADWCGPCHLIHPILDQLEQEFKDQLKIIKVDVEADRHLAPEYQVLSLPTFLIYKNGQLVERLIGRTPKEKLVELIAN